MEDIMYESIITLKESEQVALIEANKIEGKDSKDSETQKKHYMYQCFGRNRGYWAEKLTDYLVHFRLLLIGCAMPNGTLRRLELDRRQRERVKSLHIPVLNP